MYEAGERRDPAQADHPAGDEVTVAAQVSRTRTATQTEHRKISCPSTPVVLPLRRGRLPKPRLLVECDTAWTIVQSAIPASIVNAPPAALRIRVALRNNELQLRARRVVLDDARVLSRVPRARLAPIPFS